MPNEGRDEQTFETELVLGLAAALRGELGGRIEDQPGGTDPAGAGQVNRAGVRSAKCIFNLAA